MCNNLMSSLNKNYIPSSNMLYLNNHMDLKVDQNLITTMSLNYISFIHHFFQKRVGKLMNIEIDKTYNIQASKYRNQHSEKCCILNMLDHKPDIQLLLLHKLLLHKCKTLYFHQWLILKLSLFTNSKQNLQCYCINNNL
jgi:hypothetical protein